ncbi:hypothetical protein KQY27_02230 [Methanobrevibacter sp. TMH8]|uniref:DUF11 domain-containing protein n=1 Tax=Methanobrevibacter sp. TMH8 TaxID=2848611 RepID=UPI001CC9026F|nr:DUF11 domain-containing protein [Methanobrevibacter sp. TMH8]MBZ9570361.1 hypothetical protein [Methanobrevibacter sp. TMH8]
MNPNNRYHTNVTIINSIFTNNIAEWGGAIYDQNWINLTIEGTNFTNNSAIVASGGAIYIGGSDRAQINNSKFENNIAVGSGGAVSFNAMYSNITNSIFINNSANVAGAVDFASAPDGSLIYCIFINNSANNYAGALRIYSNRVLVSGSRFINNSATNYGGAIYNNANNNVIINNSDFSQNKANYGGAFYNAGDAKITRSNFISNLANYGGGIYNSNGNYLIVSANTMFSNIANDLGNEIYNNGNMGILNLKYLNNSNIIVNNNSQITLYATLTDDMGNPVTGQTVSFLIDGLSVGYSIFIEGAAELTYFVNLNTENALVNGLYLGSGNNINILNGMLRITSTSEVGGNLTLNQTEYFVNDTIKGVINVINNGPNHVYNVNVKINLPAWFNINKNDIIVSQGYYDDITGIWYIGDLVSTARAMMEFTGEFTQKGQGILSIDISGDNFNNSMDSFNFLVKEKTLNNGTNPGSNNNSNNSNNGSNKGNGSGSNGSNSGNGNGSNHKENNPPDKSKDQDFDKNSYIKKGNDNNRNNNYLVVEANMKKTGVPIVAILLILLSILGLSIRRK